MRRYEVSYSAPVSSTANTPTQAIGLVTGAGRMCAVYEVILALAATVTAARRRPESGGRSGGPLTRSKMRSARCSSARSVGYEACSTRSGQSMLFDIWDRSWERKVVELSDGPCQGPTPRPRPHRLIAVQFSPDKPRHLSTLGKCPEPAPIGHTDCRSAGVAR